jgi:hypothetical protein
MYIDNSSNRNMFARYLSCFVLHSVAAQSTLPPESIDSGDKVLHKQTTIVF